MTALEASMDKRFAQVERRIDALERSKKPPNKAPEASDATSNSAGDEVSARSWLAGYTLLLVYSTWIVWLAWPAIRKL